MNDTPEWQAPDEPAKPDDSSRPPPAAPPPPDLHHAASKPGVIPLRPLGLGEILDGAITTMRRHPAVMLGVSAAVAAISLLALMPFEWLVYDRLNDFMARVQAGEVVTDQEAGELLSTTVILGIVAVITTLLFRVFLVGFLTSVVGKAVVGQPATFSQVFADVRPRLLRLLGLTLLYPLAALVLAIPVVLAALGSPAAGGFLILLVVPIAVWLYIKFSLATPALVLEHGKVFSSLRRSSQLVKGSWWRTLGILLLASIIAGVIAAIISLPFEYAAGGFETGFGDPTAPTYVPVTMTYVVITSVGALIAATISEPFVAGVTALLYTDYRMRKEGLDIVLAQASGSAAER